MNSNKYSQCGKSDSVNRKRSLKIRLGYLLSKSASYLPSLYRKNAAWRSSCNFERLGEAIFMLRCYRNKKPHPTPRQCLCCSILWQSRTVGSVTWSQPPRVAADHRKYVGKGNDGRRKGRRNELQMIYKWFYIPVTFIWRTCLRFETKNEDEALCDLCSDSRRSLEFIASEWR